MTRRLGLWNRRGDEVEGGLVIAELAAEQLRRAIRALDSLVGRVDVEDLLDEILPASASVSEDVSRETF
jgi:tRNA modification GTPase